MAFAFPAAPPPHVRLLLRALLEPQQSLPKDRRGWDHLIRTARRSRLLGVLSARIAATHGLDRFDEVARRQLIAGQVESSFRRQKTAYLLSSIEPLLEASKTPSILLKGSAYFAQHLAFAEGRMPADVDVMVPHVALDEIEHALLRSGWSFEKNDPYDQRFYRAWSHELPPMRCAGQALELDLHHTILPPLGRLKPNDSELFAAAIPLKGSHFSVLCHEDQVLLAAAHLFHDSDCTERLRDLVDIDGLLRAFGSNERFWPTLIERARIHNLTRPLWYALAFASAWMSTPILPSTFESLERFRPNKLSTALWMTFMGWTLPPVNPDGEPRSTLASRILEGRATWLRVPPDILALHVGHKAWRGFSSAFKRGNTEATSS